MAKPPSIDPRSGFCAETNTFHSLRPAVPLPSQNLPLSFPSYAFSLLPSPLPSNPALIDAATAASLSFPELLTRVRSLASSLSHVYGLSHGHVAFILSPSSLDVPVLYLALLSIGAVATPSNPASTPSEISRQCRLVSPSVAFATSSTASKLPRHVPTILLDSPDFQNRMTTKDPESSPAVVVRQSDAAAILFSSGTTGRGKGVAVSHRNLIANVAKFEAIRVPGTVAMPVAPMFHVMGMVSVLKGVAMGETVVMSGRAGFPAMMGAAERYGVMVLEVAPPVVVAMARSEEAVRYDLRALKKVVCGGAPLAVEAAERFIERFPGVQLCQGYGLTEGGGITIIDGPVECYHLRSVGRLSENIQAKIVDNESGKALAVGQQGEIWVRGPTIMMGYVGDSEANAAAFDSDGWLKTGDLCYFDKDGFLFIVDRIKELIKYKAYQVAPAELEDLLQSLPGVIDAAVIPYPHEEVGEIPVAFVVRQSGSNLTEAEIMNHVAKQVAPYKKIRKVVFIDSIPKSAAGKILRRQLANHALCGAVSRL